MLKQEQQSEPEKRYDALTVQQMVSLASKLEETHRETLSAEQVEQIGAEVGLDPVFVRKALEQLEESQNTEITIKHGKQNESALMPSGVLRTKQELAAWAFAFAIPLIHAIAAGGMLTDKDFTSDFSPRSANIVVLALTPILLSLLPGYITGRKRAGILAGCWYTACMIATAVASHAVIRGSGFEVFVPGLILLGVVPNTIAGAIGGWLRARIAPPKWLAKSEPVEPGRQDLLDRFFALQQELDSHMQHRAFLSIDVVGSTLMKQSAPNLAVEFSFNAYRLWVEQAVTEAGGEMQTAAGDGVMAIFTRDVDAVSAAQKLQATIGAFNKKYNRLPVEFQIRCGINSGNVAVLEGTPIGHLQSPVIDRAANLQKQAQPGSIEIDPAIIMALEST